jgi:hypothetical protein
MSFWKAIELFEAPARSVFFVIAQVVQPTDAASVRHVKATVGRISAHSSATDASNAPTAACCNVAVAEIRQSPARTFNGGLSFHSQRDTYCNVLALRAFRLRKIEALHDPRTQ